MGLTKQDKLSRLAASRATLEHELYAAEVEVTVKEAGVKHKATGVTQEQVETAKAGYDGVKAQIDALDEMAKKANLEKEED